MARIQLVRPDSQYPELHVHIPDSWHEVHLAPLYDVHIGNSLHDAALWTKHFEWLKKTPNIISWDGGDLWENICDMKMGHTKDDNDAQFREALTELKPIQHKLAFKIPGNHEARTYARTGFDVSREFAERLNIPYFPDYALVTFFWRDNRFKLVAHHGSGAAATPGGQRNAARKDLPWLKPDILWTGHLHQPIIDPVKVMDYDRDGRIYERDIFVIISPSYLRYFGGYAATKRLGPGLRGLHVVTLHDDGRMDAVIHARGKRL